MQSFRFQGIPMRIRGKNLSDLRENLLTKHINSSSTAASFVVGGSRDGKLVWKTKEGKKLAEMLK